MSIKCILLIPTQENNFLSVISKSGNFLPMDTVKSNEGYSDCIKRILNDNYNVAPLTYRLIFQAHTTIDEYSYTFLTTIKSPLDIINKNSKILTQINWTDLLASSYKNYCELLKHQYDDIVWLDAIFR